ncbi:MAG: hypothetical protein ACI9H6_000854 [Patiriisocius sp.]|jgi:hypothetical protein
MHTRRTLTEEQQYILTLPFEYAYYHLLRSAFESDVCGFCTVDETINKTIFQNGHWRIQKNCFGGKRGCKTMLMITSLKHWRHLSDITKANAWGSFGEMITWATEIYNLPGGVLFLRFGPMQSNTGTIPHLHWNIWIPDPDIIGDERSVSIPIQKTWEDERQDLERTNAFALRYEAGEIP